MSEADDEVSEKLWTLARDPKYAEIADLLAEAAGTIVSLNAIIDVEMPEWRKGNYRSDPAPPEESTDA